MVGVHTCTHVNARVCEPNTGNVSDRCWQFVQQRFPPVHSPWGIHCVCRVYNQPVERDSSEASDDVRQDGEALCDWVFWPVHIRNQPSLLGSLQGPSVDSGGA